MQRQCFENKHISQKNALLALLFCLLAAMELNGNVAASQACSHSRKFVFACQAVRGKVTPRSWNSSLVSAASPHVVSLSAVHINISWRSSECVYQEEKKVIGICDRNFCHCWHRPFTLISPPSGVPALLLLKSQRCPVKCRMVASFTLHRDYNDSSSYRGTNLSIHLAKKCSTIMTSDPHFFSWKRLLPAWIREWPAGT